jgi:prepilin-type N-terminal cleavage/methylation domain-containing protein
MRKRLLTRLRVSEGFSLIELLVVVAILSIVLGAVAAGFTSALSAEGRSIVRATAEENARMSLARLRLDLHCSSGVNGLNQNADGGWTITLTEDPNACPQVWLEPGSIGVQWCTIKVGDRHWRLYRENSLDCDGINSTFMVDYLVEANPWTLIPCSPGRAESLGVRLYVNVTPNKGFDGYALEDEIALRNSVRKAVCT